MSPDIVPFSSIDACILHEVMHEVMHEVHEVMYSKIRYILVRVISDKADFFLTLLKTMYIEIIR